MADVLALGTTSDRIPDLHQVLNRLSKESDRVSFLENLHNKLTQHKTIDNQMKPILKQVVMLLVPFYERDRRWNDAAVLLEEGGFYSQAMVDYLRVQQYGGAGRCAEKSGDLKNALDLYLKAHMLLRAVEVARALGDTAKAKELAVEAIKYYTKQQEYRQAALAAEQAGMVKEALSLEADQIDHVGYADSKFMYQELVERAMQAQLILLALHLATRGDLYDQAIDLAIQHKLYDEVPTLYKKYLDAVYPKERVPIFRRYVQFLTQHASQTVARAAYKQEVEILQKKGEYLNAAHLADEAKLPERQELYKLAMIQAEAEADFAKAALAATKLGLNQEADFYRNLATMFG